MLCPLLHVLLLAVLHIYYCWLVIEIHGERISDESVQVSVCYRKNNKQRQGEVCQYTQTGLWTLVMMVYTGELRTGTRVGRAKFMQCLE